MAYKRIKHEIILNDFQKQVIEQGITVQRDMWNFLIRKVNPLVESKQININTASAKLYDLILEEFLEPFLATGISTRMIRAVVENYIQAWKNRFNPNMPTQGKPQIHSPQSEEGLHFRDVPNKIVKNRIGLPLRSAAGRLKVYSMPYKRKDLRFELKEKDTKYLSGVNKKVKQISFIRRGKRYFVMFCYETEPLNLISKDGKIGIDWGLADYFIDSNGKRYNLPKSAERQLQRIKALNKVLSKKEYGSNNYNKVKAKINEAWYRYTNIKRDFICKFVLQLCRNNSLIVIEDLNLVAMRQQTHKSRRRLMNHNSFSMFKLCLVEKVKDFQNCNLVFVDRYFPSSQICSACGKNTGKKPVSVRDFVCPYCGTHHDRDINAAKNILIEGERIFNSQSKN